MSFENGVLRVRIAAPPVEGQANRRLIEFLSALLDIARSRIAIEKGFAAKQKTVMIEGFTAAEIAERLNHRLNRRE